MKKLLSLVWLIALAYPLGAAAHATPTLYEPEASAVLESAPDRVRIRFSERVEPGASAIAVFAPDGTRVEEGKAARDPQDSYLLSVGIRATATGSYAVSWQVVSADDGHFTKGAYLFSYGSASAESTGVQFTVTYRSSYLEALFIWLELLGQALLLGALVCWLHFVRPFNLQSDGVAAQFRRRFSAFSTTACGLIVLGTMGYISYKAWQIAPDNPLSALRAMLSTVSGSYAAVRGILGLIALTVVWPLGAKDRQRRAREILLTLLLIALVLLRARVSHAAASHTLPVFSVLVTAVHLLAKSFWIGTVPAFVFLVVPLLEGKGAAVRARALITLSQLLAFALGIGGVTGVYIVWLHLKTLGNIQATHWGMQFVLLTLSAVLLLGSRLWQQYKGDRAHLTATQGSIGRREKEILGNAGIFLITEAIVGIGVLYFSSVLIITTPPVRGGEEFTQSVTSQGVKLTLAEHPSDRDVLLLTSGDSDNTVKEVIVTLTNAERGIGPIVAPLERRFPGGYALKKSALTPPGQWTIDATVQRGGAYDATASFKVDAPADFASTSQEMRTLDGFTWLMILSALAVLLLAFSLYHMGARMAAKIGQANPVLPSLTTEHPWIIALTNITALLILAVILNMHGHGSFQRACRAIGGMWHQSVPMRAGRITSDAPMMGCMVGSGKGQEHFSDAREFAEFLRPAQAKAQMQVSPAAPRVDQNVTLTFTLTDLQGNLLPNLRIEHDRILHVIIVGQDTDTFAHIHPEDTGSITPTMLAEGKFSVRTSFPKAGRYLIAVDFTVRSQTFAQEFTVTVPGANPMVPFTETPSLVSDMHEYIVHLQKPEPLQSGSLQKLSFTVEKDGKPVTDLQPYLAAPMHLAVVKQDLRRFQHTHALVPQTLWQRMTMPRNPNAKHLHIVLSEGFGPTLEAFVSFPSPGRYTLFGEFRHENEVHRARFVMDVE
ncbi:MAG: copper resistance protein CopC [Candidatus Peregrinibacteria bacterium]|nr:copper resistance protein CopC [Candidatus Peregrinibacteria bacterium]